MYAPLVEGVKGFEGFHRRVKGAVPVMAGPYLCPAGFWTIGYGHLCKQDTPPIDMDTAILLLEQDLDNARRTALPLITYPLNERQWAAVIDFTFNLGSGRLKGSRLRALINRGDFDLVPAEFRKWVWGGGKKLPGLIARREWNVTLWSGG